MILGTKINDLGEHFANQNRRKNGLSLWALIDGLFFINLGTENEDSTTTMYDIFEWQVRSACALRIAQNYCKTFYFFKITVCGKSCPEAECSRDIRPNSLHVCVVQEEVFAK